jgi:hypothetical protein
MLVFLGIIIGAYIIPSEAISAVYSRNPFHHLKRHLASLAKPPLLYMHPHLSAVHLF